MRQRKEWMNVAVDPILEILDDSGLALPPKTIRVNISRLMEDSPGRTTIFRALDALEEHEYIDRLPDPETHFVITDKGKNYLHGQRGSE